MKAVEKLKTRNGETMVEALVSILIVAACFVALCGAIVTAAHVNSSAKGMDDSFDTTNSEEASFTVTIKHSDSSETTADVDTYVTGEGFYYYE